MRVITGISRGAKLSTLEGEDVRPTSDRVKEAIFSMIQFEIEGRNVLDLFAGSGQLGIEALSRGAVSCTFVDQRNDAAAMIKQNLMNVKLFDKAKVLTSEAVAFLKYSKNIYDIVMIDPPYSQGLVTAVLPFVAPLMSPQGAIICEVAKIDELPETAGDFVLVNKYFYGKTAVGLYRKSQDD
jgi:16S rRNA (guanine966-N2)-methyltransferase